MTTDAFAALAAELQLGLHSPGLCLACLSFVAFADEADERAIRREIAEIAPVLWDEGFGDAVRFALERAAAGGTVSARPDLRELDARSWRSAVFPAVIRRLAVELRDDARRRYYASLN